MASAPPTHTAPRRAGLPHSPARCPLTSRACPLLSFRSLAGDATVPRQLPGLACSTSGSATPCRLGRVPGRSRDSQGPVTGGGAAVAPRTPGAARAPAPAAPGPPALSGHAPDHTQERHPLCSHEGTAHAGTPRPSHHAPLLAPCSMPLSPGPGRGRERPHGHRHRGVGTQTPDLATYDRALSSGARPQS